MSLETVDTQIEMNRIEAEQAQKNYGALRDQIAKDPTLSDQGKRQARDALRADFKPRLAELRGREEALIDKAIEFRLAQIEAPGGLSASEVVSFRDAQDRAERIESSAEAVPIIERALRQKDPILAHAVLRVGIEKGYGGVIDAFAAKHPEIRTTISELQKLERRKANTLDRTMQYAISLND